MKRELGVFPEMPQCVGGLGWPAALLDFVLTVTICASSAPSLLPYAQSTSPWVSAWVAREALPSSPPPPVPGLPLPVLGVEVRSAA